MEVFLYDMSEYNENNPWDGLLYEIDMGDWRPKGGTLRNNNYATISVKVKTSGKKLNLPTGQYQAALSEYTSFFRSTSLNKSSREKIYIRDDENAKN